MCCMIPSYCMAQDSIQVTYFTGDIPTSFDVYDETCNGPLTTLSVTLPMGDNFEVTNVHVEYQMTALGNGFMEHQRSRMRCVNTDTSESEVSGVGASQGIMNYDRDLSIANGIYPGGTELIFEMWARRTFEDVPGCNIDVNRVNAASWTITVYHGDEIASPRVGINKNNPVAALDVGGKIKVGDDSDVPQAGMIRWNASAEDFEGYDGTEWLSLTRGSGAGEWGDLPTTINYPSGSQYYASGQEGESFGSSVDCDDQYLIVGSPGYDNGGNTNEGRATIYAWNDTTWIAQDTITGSSLGTSYTFGSSVAIDGDYAIVGAPYFFQLGPGKAFIFERSGTQWSEVEVLTSSSTLFGTSVDISGDYAIVGATQFHSLGSGTGEAVVYHFNGADWVEQDVLTASDGMAGDDFGDDVSLLGDYAIIGASSAGSNGQAYVFHRSGTTWMEEEIIIPSLGVIGDQFGSIVHLMGDTIAVGSQGADLQGNDDLGKVYLYERNNTDWDEITILKASDGMAGDRFGWSISSDNDYILIGTYNGGGSDRGKAYLFKKGNTGWTEESILIPPDGAPDDLFGSSGSVCFPHVIIGAPGHDIYDTIDQGKVYFFRKE